MSQPGRRHRDGNPQVLPIAVTKRAKRRGLTGRTSLDAKRGRLRRRRSPSLPRGTGRTFGRASDYPKVSVILLIVMHHHLLVFAWGGAVLVLLHGLVRGHLVALLGRRAFGFRDGGERRARNRRSDSHEDKFTHLVPPLSDNLLGSMHRSLRCSCNRTRNKTTAAPWNSALQCFGKFPEPLGQLVELPGARKRCGFRP